MVQHAGLESETGDPTVRTDDNGRSNTRRYVSGGQTRVRHAVQRIGDDVECAGDVATCRSDRRGGAAHRIDCFEHAAVNDVQETGVSVGCQIGPTDSLIGDECCRARCQIYAVQREPPVENASGVKHAVKEGQSV